MIIFDLSLLMGIKFCTETLPFSVKGCLSGIVLGNSYIETRNVCSISVELVRSLERSSILLFEQRRKLFPCVCCY